MTATLVVDSRDRLAYGAPNTLSPGSFLITDSGQPLRFEEEGVFEALPHGGLPWYRSRAASPSAALTLSQAHRATSNRPKPGSQPGRVTAPRGVAGGGSEPGVSRGSP